MSAAASPLVFLLDCDNTLLDNDAIKGDVNHQLTDLLGAARTAIYWQLYEAVRHETGGVNYPLVLQRFAAICPDPGLLDRVSHIVFDYPFATRVYPAVPAVLDHLRALGNVAILSDGDDVYQAAKLEHSGLAAAVGGNVFITTHKEERLEEVMARWPAQCYVVVDDNPRILAAIKRYRPDRFVIVQVRQGHYAAEASGYSPAPDITYAAIGDITRLMPSDIQRALAASAGG
jgi:FMN phosphatase YigB (HAD superfamily)